MKSNPEAMKRLKVPTQGHLRARPKAVNDKMKIFMTFVEMFAAQSL